MELIYIEIDYEKLKSNPKIISELENILKSLHEIISEFNSEIILKLMKFGTDFEKLKLNSGIEK